MQRTNALNSLALGARMNTILTNDEAEQGAVTSDENGKISKVF